MVLLLIEGRRIESPFVHIFDFRLYKSNNLWMTYFLINADMISLLYTNRTRNCLIIHARTLVCCVVWFIVRGPLLCSKKSTVLPTRCCASTMVAMYAGRQSIQFINITWCTMEPLAARLSDSKDGRLSCQSYIQEGGMCGEYGRCPFLGQRDVKGALQEVLSICISVCGCRLFWHFQDPQGQYEQRRMCL